LIRHAIVGVLSTLINLLPLAGLTYVAMGSRIVQYQDIVGLHRCTTFLREEMGTLLVLSYIGCCATYMMAYLANISDVSADQFLIAATASIVKTTIAIPVLLSLCFAIITRVLLSYPEVFEELRPSIGKKVQDNWDTLYSGDLRTNSDIALDLSIAIAEAVTPDIISSPRDRAGGAGPVGAGASTIFESSFGNAVTTATISGRSATSGTTTAYSGHVFRGDGRWHI